MEKVDHREFMKSQKNKILDLLDDEKYPVEIYDGVIKDRDYGIFVWVEGIKLEWNWEGRCIKLGYGHNNPTDVDSIENFLINHGFPVGRTKGKLCQVYRNECTVEHFEQIHGLLQNHDIPLIKRLKEKIPNSEKGVNFYGTLFQPLQERGATISGMFGKMVCEKSGMNLHQMLAEYSIKSVSGQIDGVEICPVTHKPISIYECQSGIHNGNFLDENHLNKTLGKYLYAKEIIPTVRKVVFLAAGYSKQTIHIVQQRAQELSKRDNPVQIVLLKTTRNHNEIGIDVISHL